MSIAIGGFFEHDYIGIDLWNDNLTSKTYHQYNTPIYPDYRGICGIVHSATLNEVYIGHFDSVQIFNATTGEYKETIQIYTYGTYNYVRTIKINGDYLYVLIDDYDGYCRLKKIRLSDRSTIQYILLEHKGYAYNMDIVNGKIYIPVHYWPWPAPVQYLLEEYVLADLSYVNAYTNGNIPYIEINNSGVNETSECIYYPANDWHLMKFDTNTKNFSIIETDYNITKFAVDQITGYVYGFGGKYGVWDGFKKYDSELNTITTFPITLLYFGGMFISGNYLYLIQAINSNNKTAIYKVNLSTLLLEKSVETEPYGGYCGIKYPTSPYPPADPIDDNPDTLPDPGGDPQEITFRWETYKAIRSGRELKGL